MRFVDLTEPQKQLPALVREVQSRGEGITLVESGQPLVDIVPHRVGAKRSMAEREAAVAEILRLRDHVRDKMSFEEIDAAIDEGRL